MPRREMSKKDSTLSSDTHNATSKRPRRLPKSGLGKSSAPGVQPLPQKLSSLPPSSPFSSSSSHIAEDLLPVASSEAIIYGRQKEKPFYEQVEVEEERDFESDVYGMLGDDDNAQGHASSSFRNSDPFGFFAVEARLKVERIHRSAVAPPFPVIEPLEAPRSPHKQRIRKHPTALANAAKGDPSSLPSSPSPAKPPRVTKRGLAKEASKNGDETEKEHIGSDIHGSGSDLEDDHTPKRAKILAAGEGKSRRTKNRHVDPEKLARDLKARLPKRATRRSARLARNRMLNADSDSEDAGRGTRKGAKRIDGKQEKDLEDTTSRELTAEQQKRIEYYQKLDEYSIEKENVYVI